MNLILRTTAVAALIGSFALAAAAQGTHPDKSASESSTYSPELNTGRDSLRKIVQQQCVVNWIQKQSPAPCERVFLPDLSANSAGYAVLADRKGGAHYLLIPTQTMAGNESGELLDRDLPNYFAAAWHARDLLTRFVGHAVPRAAVGLAVNTAHSRTQDQFHIHIECLRQDVVDSLHAAAERIGSGWAPAVIAGSTYQAMRVMADGLDGVNPFELLANLSPDVRHRMGDYTLVVAGMQFQGNPGFIVLTGTGPTGELLLDGTCAAAGAGG